MDKRFCGVCATKGHSSAECPRLIGIARAQRVVERELTGETITLTVEDGTKYVAQPTSNGLVWHGVTENTVTKKRRGRPNKSNALTPAEKQKAYRERRKL